MDSNNINFEDVRSFTFTLDTPDEDIIDLCKRMGVPKKEAISLIEIKNKYSEEDAYTQVV